MNDNNKIWKPDDANHLSPKIPLFREMPPSEPYPLSALGTLLQAAAESMKDAIQAPDALYGQSLLGAAALATQGHADVSIDGRDFPLSLYMLSVGGSGERKSAVDKVVLSPHMNIERQRMTEYESELQKYIIRHNAWVAAQSQATKKVGKEPNLSVDLLEQKLESLGPAPKKPLSQLRLIDEPTFEGLQKMLSDGYPAVGLFSDEGGRMMGGHAMNSDNQLKTIAGLSKFWDGAAVPRIRSVDGATKLYGKRLSLHLMVQPRIAAQITSDPVLVDQGILARCLIAFPESTVGTRFYKDIDIRKNAAIIKYNDAMTQLLEMELPIVEGKVNELNPRKLPLASSAKSPWVAFHNYVEEEMAIERKFSNIRGFASKAAEHALRISGVLALIDDVHSSSISREHVESGIQLTCFYLSEAVRMHESAMLNPDLHLAQKLSDWCQKYEVIFSSLVYQRGPNAIREKAISQKMIKILEEHGHLKRVGNGLKIEGTFHSDAWEVVK